MLGSDHPLVAASQSRLAGALLEPDRPDDARPQAEHAWVRRQGNDTPLDSRAEIAFVLARALWAAESSVADRTRARALAEDALRSFEAAGEAHGNSADKVRQWLDSHRLP
ncbi:MAG: hypothetical protein AAGF11_49880 [Myxococcota bacterium]